MKTVCVIGAGPSGITAAKNFKDQGFKVTVFDYGNKVGGNWRYEDNSGHSSVFETTHIISSKTQSQYLDFPLPKTASDYPSHKELLGYFTAYAEHFGVTPLVQFGTLVKNCLPQENGGWSVTVEQEKVEKTFFFDALVVCNGHHWKPRWPKYPGKFTGEYIHSHNYKKAEPFRGKRVLVIGGGNSACDVAVETSRISTYTDISWRRGYWLIPKFLFGLPSDVLGNSFDFLPIKFRQVIIKWVLLLTQGRNRAIGLQEPDHKPGETHPTVNSELYYFVRHGKVKPQVDIESFKGQEVKFKDGTIRTYDSIIACTGYEIVHPFLDRDLIDLSKSSVPLYMRFLPAQVKNLYFIGLFQPIGCIWPGAELQSKLAALHLAGKWKAPRDLAGAISTDLKNSDFGQLATPRHTITVDDLAFRKRLKREIDLSLSA